MKTIGYFRILAITAGLAGPVLAQPVITNQPLSITNLVGTTATFTVGADGIPPLAFQWWYGGKGLTYPLPNDTNASLILSNVQSFSSTGSYWAVVTNVEGAVTSALATLTVLMPPRIDVQPVSQTASLFADARFSVLTAGDPPLSYQWRLNTTNLVTMTNSTLSVTKIQRSDAGDYDVVITNFSGSVTSKVATLTIVAFNSLYFFGFSWTDTGGNGCTWPAPQYYGNRACNGPMWPEFLSTNLSLSYVRANDHAHCGALAVDVLNQVINFMPPIHPELSMYFLWAGDSDFLRAYPPNGYGLGYISPTNEVAWSNVIHTLMVNNSNAVDHLYAKGARAIVFETLDDFSEEPGALAAFGTDTVGLAKLSEHIKRFNASFIQAMEAYQQTKPDLRILSVDILPRLNDVLVNPGQYGLTKTRIDVLDDSALGNKSFTGPGADYVFWDSGHVTSKVNKLFADWHLDVLTNSVLESLELGALVGSPVIQMNHLQIGRDYTLQRSVGLNTWTDVEPFTATAGTNQWAIATNGATAEFFRLKWSR
jgi:phospholipase/lecithinase/hemolysin